MLQKLADDNSAVTEFQSELAFCHQDIARSLAADGKPAEALKAYETARAIQQRLADANPTITVHQSLLANCYSEIGILMTDTGHPADAMKAYQAAREIWRKLVDANPAAIMYKHDFAAVSTNIGNLLAFTGRPAEAAGEAEAERELTKLRDSDPTMVALDARLAAVIKGPEKPRDQAERLALAQRAYDKDLHATAARLWGDALAANPSLADDRNAQHAYNAACAAARAGCGRSKDDPSPDEVAKANLRKRALDWLKAELAVWSRLLDSDATKHSPLVAKTLEHWRVDTDLPGIRDQKELAKLPEVERSAFQPLWSKVDGVLKKARAGE